MNIAVALIESSAPITAFAGQILEVIADQLESIPAWMQSDVEAEEVGDARSEAESDEFSDGRMDDRGASDEGGGNG